MMLEAATARMERYGLLRWGYLPTHPLAWGVIQHADWHAKLREALEGLEEEPAEDLGTHLDGLVQAADAFQEAEEWEGAYHETFDQRVRCSVYSTDYTSTHTFQQARELADISGFYRAFGLVPSEDVEDRVDHVGQQCEFLYLLAFQEARLAQEDDEAGAEIHRDATIKFLETHTGRFTGRMLEALEGSDVPPFFLHLAALTHAAVAHDVDRLGLEPAPPPAWTDLMDQPPDAPACGRDPRGPGPGPEALLGGELPG